MNEEILRGQWKQFRGKFKVWWGKLTDDDLDIIDGRRDQLIGKLHERYGYTKEEAEKEVDMRMKELERQVEGSSKV